jgi:NADH dehydrogenase
MANRDAVQVTIFGGAGFIGRYVCEFLLKQGVRIRVAQRDIRSAHVVQPLGQVGQIGYVRADIRNADSVRAALARADAVINLCGTFGRHMHGIHADGARNVAVAAREAGASALVHLSAIGADPAGESRYASTKGEGEAAIRAKFPGATIIRPSVVFGPEDQFTNRFAALGRLPAVPVLAAKTRFQPVYVRDLAKAIGMAVLDPGAHGGKTYEVAGPEVMTMAGLHRAIYAITGQSPDLIELPNFVGDLMSRVGFLPGAPITRDQWLMLRHDNVAAPAAAGLPAFGIVPTPLAAVGEEWLRRFRRGGKFSARRVPITPAV